MKKRVIATYFSGILSTYAGTMGVAAEPDDFSGFYGGLGTGFSTFFLSDPHSITTTAPNANINRLTKATTTGILFEGQIGYGKMLLPLTYLGIKGSVYYTPMNFLFQDSTPIASSGTLNVIHNVNPFSLKPIYNINGVLGYELFPKVMPFIEGGVSFSNVTSHQSQNNSFTNLTTSSNSTYTNPLASGGYKTNYNVGIGSWYQWNEHVLLSTELVYHDLGRYNVTNTVAIPSAGTETVASNKTYQLVSLLATASYLFPVS